MDDRDDGYISKTYDPDMYTTKRLEQGATIITVIVQFGIFGWDYKNMSTSCGDDWETLRQTFGTK